MLTDYSRYVINTQKGTIFSIQRNKKCKGSLNTKFYRQVTINGKPELLHRVIYAYHHKVELHKKDIIDHIDRNKENNCVHNLRLVSHSQNNQNKKTRVDSKTESKGVYITSSGKYSVRITHQGKPIYLGTFSTIQRAREAYYREARQLNDKDNANFHIPPEFQEPQTQNEKLG